MISGQIRVIRHTHKCIATFFACAPFFPLTLLHFPAVGKVGTPRRGHPLVEFGIDAQMGRFAQDHVHTRACTHALKARPREVRTVNLV